MGIAAAASGAQGKAFNLYGGDGTGSSGGTNMSGGNLYLIGGAIGSGGTGGADGNVMLNYNGVVARGAAYFGGTTVYIQGGTTMAFMGGNVGIGTASPEAKLDVGGYYFHATMKSTAAISGAKGALAEIPTYQLSVRDTTSMADGVGGAIVFEGNYTGTTPTPFGAIEGVKSNATDANYAGELRFRTRVHGGNLTQKMVIDAVGYVGIGMVPTKQLELSLDSAQKPSTNTWTVTSDARIKKDIHPFSKGLSELLLMRPVQYHYNGRRYLNEPADAPYHVGIIAQEWQGVCPEMIGVSNDGYLDYQGHNLAFMTVNAIQELHVRIAELEGELSALKARINLN